MEAKEKSLRFLGETKEFEVPFFQRRYIWNEQNWKELLESFENIDAIPYLGSLIFKDKSNHSRTKVIIIDGQQRLTTISILAKAIFDSIPESSKKPGSGVRKCVESYLFYIDNAADDFEDSKIKIIHSRLDKEDYSKVMSAGMLKDYSTLEYEKINENSGNISKCYKYFYELLRNRTEDELKRLYNSVFDQDKNIFVCIYLKFDDVSEQQIFDTLNRAGEKLSSADIIKNNLFKVCLDKKDEVGLSDKDIYDFYDETWEKTFYNTEEDQKNGRLKDLSAIVQEITWSFFCIVMLQ